MSEEKSFREQRQEAEERRAELPVVKTARNIDDINDAVRKGYRAVFRKVEPLDTIRSKFAIVEMEDSGEYKVLGDYREDIRPGYRYRKVIDWTSYYPHNFPNPYAAYIVPPQIRPGTRVLLVDLIEDVVGATWNQGDSYRLKQAEAIWDGNDLELQHNPLTDVSKFIG